MAEQNDMRQHASCLHIYPFVGVFLSTVEAQEQILRVKAGDACTRLGYRFIGAKWTRQKEEQYLPVVNGSLLLLVTERGMG